MKKLMLACLIFLGCSENTSPTDDLAILSQDKLSNSSSSFLSSLLEPSSSTELSISLLMSSSLEPSSSKELSSSLLISSSLEPSSNSLTSVTGTMTDSRDGKTYKTVVIGTQTWMAENLNYGSYLADLDDFEQLQLGAQKFCYEKNESNCTTDGGLYQWHTAMGFAKTCGDGSINCSSEISSGNHQGICPSGWHMPKGAEWDILQTYLVGSSVAGKTMKLNNTGNASWDAFTNNDGNRSGFSALPSGRRNYNGGFSSRGRTAYFWEAVESSSNDARNRTLYDAGTSLYRYSNNKQYGFSVRCAQD
jgi:uncharacterized protein (TIGR02145 family)